VPAAELDAAIDRVLADVLAGAPHALALQKRLILEWEERGMAGAIAAGIDAFAEAWTTPEPAARMRHFLESKRRA
jgi:enoyl-CoA hydratase/carnithine racemase